MNGTRLLKTMTNLTKLDLGYIVHGNSKRIEFKESYRFFNHTYIRDVFLDNVLIRNFFIVYSARIS